MSPQENPLSARDRLAPYLKIDLLLVAHSMLLFFWFLPEIQHASIYYNDAISHIAVIRQMDEVWRNGGNILDFWMANINLGHALLRSYQFLMHFLVWSCHKTIFFWLPIETTFNLCATLMVIVLPWTIAKGFRLFGLKRNESIFAAIALSLFHEKGGYGVGLTNFTYSGYGTYTQLYALVFLPLALGYGHRALNGGTGLVRSSIFFALTLFSHILVAYFAAIWLLIDFIFTLVSRQSNRGRVLGRAGLYIALTFIFSAFWSLPLALDLVWQHKSAFEPYDKFVGFGAKSMFGALYSGGLADHGRIPVLTGLGLMGFVLCFIPWFQKKSRSETFPYRFISAQMLIWFLISFGPATWGTFLTSLPFATNMHWHRAFLMFQITLAACTGIAFVSFLSALNKVFTEKINPPQPQYWTAGIAATLVSLVFAGPLVERHRYFYKTNAHWLSESKKSWTDNLASQDLLRFAQSKTGTRFYAGTHPNVLPGSWGNDLRVTTYIPVYGLFAQHNVESVGPIYHHQNHTEDASFRYLWKSKAHNELFNIGYLVANDKQTMPPEFKNTNKFGSASVYTTGIQENYFAFAKIFPENAFLPDAALPCADNAGLVRATLEFLFSRLPETGQFPAFQLQRRCRTSNELDQFLKDLKKSSDVPPKGQFTAAGRATGKSSYNYWAEGQNETATALVFKMNFHPLWSLKINGVEVEKRLVSPALIAVPIPAGHFRIEAEYQPGRLRLIFATLTLAFGGVLIALRRRTALAGIW